MLITTTCVQMSSIFNLINIEWVCLHWVVHSPFRVLDYCTGVPEEEFSFNHGWCVLLLMFQRSFKKNQSENTNRSVYTPTHVVWIIDNVSLVALRCKVLDSGGICRGYEPNVIMQNYLFIVLIPGNVHPSLSVCSGDVISWVPGQITMFILKNP